MVRRLENRVAVVTGAGRGIGRGIALAMAAEGARVIVNDYGKKAVHNVVAGNAAVVVEEIVSQGGVAVPSADNVATGDGARSIIQTALDKLGKVDILVNNAGTVNDRMIWNMEPEQWDFVVDVILKGSFNCARAAAPHMKKQRFGRIINLISTAGLLGNTGGCNYAAAKAGLVGFTNALARELGYYGITSNMISPMAQSDEDVERGAVGQYAGNPLSKAAIEHRAKYGIKRLYFGLGATGEEAPARVAPLAVFLASDAAANVNGQILGARGELIEVWRPHTIDRVFEDIDGHWTADSLCQVMPAMMADVFNFAPAMATEEK